MNREEYKEFRKHLFCRPTMDQKLKISKLWRFFSFDSYKGIYEAAIKKVNSKFTFTVYTAKVIIKYMQRKLFMSKMNWNKTRSENSIRKYGSESNGYGPVHIPPTPKTPPKPMTFKQAKYLRDLIDKSAIYFNVEEVWKRVYGGTKVTLNNRTAQKLISHLVL